MSIIDKSALIRIIIFLFAWLNQYLTAKGLDPIPVLGEEEIADILTFVVSIWTLIKDNTIKKMIDSSN